jgi:exopolysaccharide biosynthesis WecB/TagA/CpsF family protein
LGVGAAIEFQAGLLKRAPRWMQRSGTEWIYRMLSDPRRLVKRYASNAAFLLVVGREILGKQKNIDIR